MRNLPIRLVGQLSSGSLFVSGDNLYCQTGTANGPLFRVTRVVDGENYWFHRDMRAVAISPVDAMDEFDVAVCDDCGAAVHLDHATMFRNRHDHVIEHVACDACTRRLILT